MILLMYLPPVLFLEAVLFSVGSAAEFGAGSHTRGILQQLAN